MGARRVGVYSPHQSVLFESPVVPITQLSERPRRERTRSGRVGARATPGAMVLEFHQAFDLPVAPQPTAHVSAQLVELRHDLLAEELNELARALDARDVVGIADALADAVYVLYGTAWTFGINLDEVFSEVHRANMSKLGASGQPLTRPDGKVLKGPDYEPPDLRRVLGLDQPERSREVAL